MIYKSFALFCFFVFIACQNQKDSSSKSEVKTEASPQTEEKAVAKPPFTDLESFVGKNASEVQLFAKYQLNERLKAIMGSEYTDFNTGWKDLGTIKKDIDIIYTAGCKADACDDTKYFLMMDIMTNELNIFYFSNKRIRSFEEGSIIGMPENVANDYEKIRKSAGGI
ncbi:MAG: hypothetical protein IPL08_10210 [Saprospiraceae bacterium]|nr:hypothetical protein [Saprospiraceae bacterium]MBK8669842.1 hypothetical protein [Saprospiraceae bacterium]